MKKTLRVVILGLILSLLVSWGVTNVKAQVCGSGYCARYVTVDIFSCEESGLSSCSWENVNSNNDEACPDPATCTTQNVCSSNDTGLPCFKPCTWYDSYGNCVAWGDCTSYDDHDNSCSPGYCCEAGSPPTPTSGPGPTGGGGGPTNTPVPPSPTFTQVGSSTA